MDVSGKPYEGWMAAIPLAVLILFVVATMGGPTEFVNTVSLWFGDLSHYVARWIKSF